MIQNQFLNYLLKTKDTSLLLLNDINVSYFSDYPDEFSFIQEHINKYNQCPDISTFLYKFPNFQLIEVDENPNALLDNLVRDRNERYIARTFNTVKDLMNADKVEEAYDYYINAAEKLVSTQHFKCVDILKNTDRYSAYVEKSKDFGKHYVLTGLSELDRIIGGWDRSEELATIVARTNMGKCLAKGTKILMADGTMKAVEDVRVGDQVQSLNRVNTVLCLHSGKSKGYKIIPESGDPFIISEQHILTCLVRNDCLENNSSNFTIDNPFSMIDISIEDYLKLSENQRQRYLLYRPAIEYSHKDLAIPPYAFGLQLCDETSYHNEHIPIEYLTSDRTQRLELLAGILDSNGYLNKSSVSLYLKSKVLIENVAQLARGLGFSVDKISEQISENEKEDLASCYAIAISGDVSIIPSHLIKGSAKKTSSDKYLSLTDFAVEPVDEVEYYGFMADGDHRYLLSDNTLTHNTWLLLKFATAAIEQGLNIGLYSGEMSENKVGYRVDTLLSHISNKSITHGNVEIQNQYKRFIDSLPDRYTGSFKVLTPSMIGGPAGVNMLRAFIEREHLDILFVDQHSLLKDDRNAKNPVERASNISQDLKNLQVMKQIPIISVSQQNRSKNDDGNVDSTQIAQSDRIGQDSTIVLFFEQKDGNGVLTLVKSRDSENGKRLNYTVDFDKGQFIYVPTETDGTGGDTCSDLRDQFGEDPDPGTNVY